VSAQRKIVELREQCFLSCWFHTFLPRFLTWWPEWTVLTRNNMHIYNPVPHVFDSEVDPVLIAKRDTLNIHFFWDNVGFNWVITSQFGNFSSMQCNCHLCSYHSVVGINKKKFYYWCLGQTLIFMIKSIKKLSFFFRIIMLRLFFLVISIILSLWWDLTILQPTLFLYPNEVWQPWFQITTCPLKHPPAQVRNVLMQHWEAQGPVSQRIATSSPPST
jgi:hypothetical protein